MSELLEQTSAALQDYVVNQGFLPGVHGSIQPQIGGKGRVVSDVLLNPSNFDLSAIDPFSIDGIVSDGIYVTRTIPHKRLYVSVIVQADRAQDHPGIVAAKRQLASTLLETIDASMPDRRDRVYGYYLGNDPFQLDDFDVEALPYSTDSTVNTRTVADVCQQGLAFVISDFKRLQFGQEHRSSLPAAVAVKLNHPFELAIPANSGNWTLGGGKVLKTNNMGKLAQANNELRAYHDQQESLLRAARFAVAAVVSEPKNHVLGFNEQLADDAIATAIQSIIDQQ